MPNLRTRPARAATLAAVLVAAAPAAAAAKPVTADLRVEAGNRALAAGSRYVTESARIRMDTRPACGGSGRVKTVSGPTALGLVADAAGASGRLRPLAVSDKFSFGLFVCGVGGFFGDESRFWLYKVNHVAPEVGGDQFRLRGGEQVLWYFQDSARGLNTGDELELRAPARARPGRPLTLTVYAYDAAGTRRPAAGVHVFGGSGATTNAQGRASVTPRGNGDLRLRAVRGGDIPSEPVHVCLNRVLSRCSPVRGERIFGTARADRIRGTRGPDSVRARGGADRIDVSGGGADRVRCGSGRDVVRVDPGDRAARDCELVRFQ